MGAALLLQGLSYSEASRVRFDHKTEIKSFGPGGAFL
jgi:hypothetical protein